MQDTRKGFKISLFIRSKLQKNDPLEIKRLLKADQKIRAILHVLSISVSEKNYKSIALTKKNTKQNYK